MHGGGNNFGIVTRITFKALPYSGVWGGILSYGANPTAVFNAVLNFEEKVKDPKANIIISVNYMNGTVRFAHAVLAVEGDG